MFGFPPDPLRAPIRFVTQRLWMGLQGRQRIREEGKGVRQSYFLKIQEVSRGQMRAGAMERENKSRKRN